MCGSRGTRLCSLLSGGVGCRPSFVVRTTQRNPFRSSLTEHLTAGYRNSLMAVCLAQLGQKAVPGGLHVRAPPVTCTAEVGATRVLIPKAGASCLSTRAGRPCCANGCGLFLAAAVCCACTGQVAGCSLPACHAAAASSLARHARLCPGLRACLRESPEIGRPLIRRQAARLLGMQHFRHLLGRPDASDRVAFDDCSTCWRGPSC